MTTWRMLRRGVSREENNAKGVRTENLSELRKTLAEVPRPTTHCNIGFSPNRDAWPLLQFKYEYRLLEATYGTLVLVGLLGHRPAQIRKV